MRLLLKSFLVGAVLCSVALTSLPSKANIFYIEDQNDRFTISFPDIWKKVGNQKTDDKLTFIAPGKNNFASCKVRVNSDRRFVIYPEEFNAQIQRTYISDEFWNDYLSDHNDVSVEKFTDDAGLGFSHASMVEASFETTQGAIVAKRGVIFASLYHDQLYVVDCSSEASIYPKFRPAFLSIIKSIDFDRVTSERKNGHYRGFMQDPAVEVEGPREFDNYKF